ncbi:hypothetical protein GCM10009858_42290 [Terrabacter carboxydivorans]|uniref:Uncharacterized protein n=1 Tax=Terrabacter carboxydivorans TaxID=619730 RepID=A0ABN3MC19_9MICO
MGPPGLPQTDDHRLDGESPRAPDVRPCRKARITRCSGPWDDMGVNGGEPIDEESPAALRTWDSTIGPDGIGYLIEAAPSGVVGWHCDQALNFDYGFRTGFSTRCNVRQCRRGGDRSCR